MKLNLDTPILDLKGKEIKEGEFTMTLGRVIVTAMFMQLQEDTQASSDTKLRQYKLAILADKGGEASISTEDVSFIKARIGKLYGALVVGRVYEIIEGEVPEIPSIPDETHAMSRRPRPN